jgi:hypothetical protein
VNTTAANSAIAALRTPNASLVRVPNTIRQSIADVIENLMAENAGLRDVLSKVRSEGICAGAEYVRSTPGKDRTAADSRVGALLRQIDNVLDG